MNKKKPVQKTLTSIFCVTLKYFLWTMVSISHCQKKTVKLCIYRYLVQPYIYCMMCGS